VDNPVLGPIASNFGVIPLRDYSFEHTSLLPGGCTHEEHPSIDVDLEVSSFLPVTPAIRRLFALEVDTARASYVAGMRILKKNNQDGSFPCPYEACGDVLPTSIGVRPPRPYTCLTRRVITFLWLCDLLRNTGHSAVRQTKVV